MKVYPPLPWCVRLRLWVSRQRDGFAIWLVERHRLKTAELVWRATGGWR